MIKAKKEFGQNFLKNPAVIQKMVTALDIQPSDVVYEIGPGLGAITERLAEKKPASITAIELDYRLLDHLKRKFSTNPTVSIIQSNVLDWFPMADLPTNYKVVGSLPYYVTSPILHLMTRAKVMPEVCVFMVQKEVAEKIAASAPDASYLSVYLQTFYDVTYLGKVANTDFDPVPKVDGGLVKFVKKETKLDLALIRKYEGFLHRAFSNPRKMLNKVFDKEFLAVNNIDANLRPQNLTVENYLNLFKADFISQQSQ